MRSLLPRITKKTFTRRGVYIILGSHIDGRWCIYVGSSDNIPMRVAQHLGKISRLRAGFRYGNRGVRCQKIHKILGFQSGWEESMHIAVDFERSLNSKDIPTLVILCEMILVIVLRSMKPQTLPAHLPASARELFNIIPALLIFQAAIIGANRILPILEPHGKAWQSSTDLSLFSCDACATASSSAWFSIPYQGDSFEQATLLEQDVPFEQAAQEFRDIFDACNAFYMSGGNPWRRQCQTRGEYEMKPGDPTTNEGGCKIRGYASFIQYHPLSGKWVCSRERWQYSSNFTLPIPRQSHSREIHMVICESCGRSAKKDASGNYEYRPREFEWIQKLDKVVCKREKEQYAFHDELQPLRRMRPKGLNRCHLCGEDKERKSAKWRVPSQMMLCNIHR